MAMALGVQVGIVGERGDEVEKLLRDPFWESTRLLTALAEDAEALRQFLHK